MKKLSYAALVVTLLFTLSGCVSTKYVPYFQNIDQVNTEGSRMLYDAKIMPKDQLTITVSTTDPTAATPFNLSVSKTNNSGFNTSMTSSAGMLLPYLVDNQGNIDFPVLGKLHVAGMTKNECQDMISNRVRGYLAESEKPIVTVQMSSYRVSVMGEVSRPCVVSVATEKISILEALAQAGDLTIYGRRDNVTIIREDATGQKNYYRVNLNDASIVNSPYYYLQQNDIVYVEPNSTKAKNSDIGQSTTLTISVTSILLSVASLIVNILR